MKNKAFKKVTLSFSPRPSILAAIVAAALILTLSGVAFAAGDAHADEGEVLKQTIYQGLNLALLLGVLIYFGRKPISEFFSGRRSGIQSELSDAANLLAEAEQRNTELQRRLVDLGSEIEGIREEAGRRAEEEADRILVDARATADRIRRDAQAAVGQELRRAQSTLREEAADLALELAARKLDEQVGDSDRERLVDEFILRVEANSGEGVDR